MGWLQLEIHTSHADATGMEEVLLEAGAISVTLEDAGNQPIFEPEPGGQPIWRAVMVKALLPAEANAEGLIALLCAQLKLARPPAFRITHLQQQDWERAWLRDFKPERFGQRLWVCPTVFTPPDPQAVNIMLDPGLAFGTGGHASTALCLEWLDAQSLVGKTVIDYGCGSGILAIAAAKLGATRVYAVDHDPQALLATCENALRNEVNEHLVTYTPQALPEMKAELLVANILARPLIALASSFSRLLDVGGLIGLSGILGDQEPLIRKAYSGMFSITGVRQRENWLLITGCRSGTQHNTTLQA